MNQLRIIHAHPDGDPARVSYTVPCEEDRQPSETDEQQIERICKTHGIVPFTVMHCAEIAAIVGVGVDGMPHERFLNAWTWDGHALSVHLGRARDLLLGEIRRNRNQKLIESDSEKARLDDIGTPTDKGLHAAYRQALRDFPATIPEMTVEQMMVFAPTWPAKIIAIQK